MRSSRRQNKDEYQHSTNNRLEIRDSESANYRDNNYLIPTYPRLVRYWRSTFRCCIPHRSNPLRNCTMEQPSRSFLCPIHRVSNIDILTSTGQTQSSLSRSSSSLSRNHSPWQSSPSRFPRPGRWSAAEVYYYLHRRITYW